MTVRPSMPVCLLSTLLAVLLLGAACGASGSEASRQAVAAASDPTTEAAPAPAATETPTIEVAPTAAPAQTPTTVAAEPTAVATTAPLQVPGVVAPNGRSAPRVATTAADLAAQVAAAERGLVAADSTQADLERWGHLHQVAIRKIGKEAAWDDAFFDALPAEFHDRTNLHLAARRSLLDLHSGYDAADFIPAWEIVRPESAADLVSYYQEAEDATGIEWEYLAAINLIETGMGRIRGLSSAGAQGPMQFLPSTWAEAGIGEGDINNPRDAVSAAARYLVRRGGPSDMPGALWGYNNSDNYVAAVQSYAELLRQDPNAFLMIYHWEIYFFTEQGDVWLPAGFRTNEVIDLDDFLAANPWSAPDPGLS